MTLTAIKYIKVLDSLNVSVEAVEETLKLFRENPQLKEALEDPTVANSNKYAAIDRIFDGEMRNLIKVLCKYSDIGYLEEIASNYREYVNAHHEKINAVLRYVTRPDESRLEEFKVFLSRNYDATQVEFKLEKDESLIGGFVLDVDGREYDWSLKGRIAGLRDMITGGKADGRN